MPRLRHVQHEAVLIERLESEWRVRRNLRHEAGVRIPLGVQHRLAVRVFLAQRNLTEHAQPLARVVHEMIPIIRRPAEMRSVAAVRVWLHREDAHRVDFAVRIAARVASLVFPIAALAVLRGVESVESMKRVRPRHDHAGKALALVETARAHQPVRRSFRQRRVDRAIIRQPGQFGRLVHAMHGAIRHHRARPALIISRIILDEHKLRRVRYHRAAARVD